jgi:hypothetical protein
MNINRCMYIVPLNSTLSYPVTTTGGLSRRSLTPRLLHSTPLHSTAIYFTFFTSLHLHSRPSTPAHSKQQTKQKRQDSYYTTERVFTDSTFASTRPTLSLSLFLSPPLFSSHCSSAPPPLFLGKTNSNRLTDALQHLYNQGHYARAGCITPLPTSPLSFSRPTPLSPLYSSFLKKNPPSLFPLSTS